MKTSVWTLLLAALLVFLGPGGAGAAESLPALGTKLEESSVSGLSSGAYMAGQFHLAYSESIVGAGIVAGGPFACAESWYAKLFPWAPGATSYNIWQAQYGCMQTYWGRPDHEGLLDRAKELAEAGRIDSLSGLSGDRVYLFSGEADATVTESVVEAAADFYRLAGLSEPALLFERGSPAAHAFVTEDAGLSCGISGPPFINDCDYDQAGRILGHIYGDLEPPLEPTTGRWLEFDQSEFLENPTTKGMAETGVAYIPSACDATVGCRVHIALHGCRQNREAVGSAFVKGSGYVRWAESNRLVILFPQSSVSSGNPRACWDWWGYSGLEFYAKDAPQLAALWRMLTRLADRPDA